MIHLTSDNDLPLAFDPSGPLSPVKPGHLSIDLSDLISTKTAHTPSALSSYDCVSNKAEEDNIGKFGFDSLSIASLKTAENSSALDDSYLDKKITIGEIISKRSYVRKPKGEKSTKTTAKRRRKNKDDNDSEEVITKKEKLSNGKYKEVIVPTEQKPAVPELIIKDGKVQVANVNDINGGRLVKKELEIVQLTKKKVTTSTSFKNVNHTEKWTEKETEKFYRALQLFGTDFSMIAGVFKNRNRNQIKNKYLREEKLQPEKVNSAFKQIPTTKSFKTIFEKYGRIKKSQQRALEESQETLPVQENKGFSLLLPLQRPQPIKSEEITTEIKMRDRNESGSFHSTSSLDSVDRAIMDDLSDILFPAKNLLC